MRRRASTTLSPTEARELTDQIKATAAKLWMLLLRAYEGQAWKARGYDSWRNYAKTEFNISQSRAYQLLDQARVTKAIEEGVGISKRANAITRRAQDSTSRASTIRLAGRAQSQRGEFIIRIDGPSDSVISVECIEGCAVLIGSRDVGLYREESARTTYSYGPCRGAPDGRCRATFHGFLKK